MIRLLAIWTLVLSALILIIILREEALVHRGKVPVGRLRRWWHKEDRRRKARYRTNWPVRYRRTDGEFPIQSQIRDLSTAGVGLVLNEYLEIGTSLELEFFPPNRSVSLKAPGQVVWCKEIPLGEEGSARVFFVGIRFYPLDPKTEQDLQKALGEG